jgi:RHS repeat-associated protein
LSTVTTFDAAGRVASVTSPEGRTVSTATTFVDGERVETTTAVGVGTTRRRFNFRDELVEDSRLYANEDLLSQVLYEYDDRGNVAAVTDPNDGRVTYSYDGRGNRLTRTSDPGGGPVTETWSYNAADQVTVAADQLDRETSYGYDPAGRLETVTDPSGRSQTYTYRGDGAVENVVYGHGEDTVSVTYGYDAAGRRTSAEIDGAAGETSYGYDDPYGGMTRAETPEGEVIEVDYDDAGRRETLTYPDETEVAYAYDDYGRLATVTDPDLGETTYSYDGDGNLLEEAMPDGQYRRWARDPATGRVELYDTVIEEIRRTTAVTYDPFGRLWIDWTDGEVTTYGYDPADQLTSVRHSDSAFDTTITGDDITYTYDAVGNRTTRVQGPPGGTEGTVETYSYDDANQLVALTSEKGSVAYDYDDAGRLTAYGTDSNDDQVVDTTPDALTTIGYDPRGLATDVVTDDGTTPVEQTRDYDASGMLTGVDFTSPVAIGLAYIWDPTRPVPQVLETVADNGVSTYTTRFLFGAEDLPGGSADRIGINFNGSIETNLATDLAGSVIASANSSYFAAAGDYDEWGNPVGPDTNPNPDWLPTLGYRGELQTDTSIHLRNRDYLLTTGTFTTTDPLDGVPGAPMEANRYPYANNSPSNLTDPNGLRANDDDVCSGASVDLSLSGVPGFLSRLGRLEVAGFIPEPTSRLGPFGLYHGDDRGFANGPIPLDRSRFFASIDFATNQSHIQTRWTDYVGGGCGSAWPISLDDDFFDPPVTISPIQHTSIFNFSTDGVAFRIEWSVVHGDRRGLADVGRVSFDGALTIGFLDQQTAMVKYDGDCFPSVEAYLVTPNLTRLAVMQVRSDVWTRGPKSGIAFWPDCHSTWTGAIE